jgi:hypothetical protein
MRHTGAQVALTEMFSKKTPVDLQPASDASEMFLRTFLDFKNDFDHLTSHYLLVIGLFDFHQLKELDDAWQQLAADVPSWPADFFYNQ